ncbi:MAG TPA: YggT family protein [Pyrinomonadaceae bacterium]
MQIIQRTFEFVQMAIAVVIFGVIVLMIVRLIVDGMDLNPFAWTSRTVRRLTDWLVIPVRGGLRNVGADPKFAPLVVILISILLGFFLAWLASTIFGTVIGVIDSAQRGAIIPLFGFIIYGVLSVYLLLISMRVVFGWAQLSYTNRLMRFLVDATEPLLGPLRRMIPPLGMFDLSPFVAGLLIWLFLSAVSVTMLSGPAGSLRAF